MKITLDEYETKELFKTILPRVLIEGKEVAAVDFKYNGELEIILLDERK
jgi:hypothetical protein